MYESIYKNNELGNEVSLDMSYFWYSDKGSQPGTVEDVPLSEVVCLEVAFIQGEACCMEAVEGVGECVSILTE